MILDMGKARDLEIAEAAIKHLFASADADEIKAFLAETSLGEEEKSKYGVKVAMENMTEGTKRSLSWLTKAA